MRFKKHIGFEHGLKPIDIVPLVTMVFILLLFIMFASSFVIQPGIKLDLPKALTSEAVNYENIEITVSADDSVYLDGKSVDMKGLNNFLKQLSGRKNSVLIKSDKRASLGKAVEIWDICRNLGIAQVNIATNQ